MRVLFLLGAGASKFGGACMPSNPPLGAKGELFQALQKRGGVAATITGAMAAEFERDFEGGMAIFMRERERDATALLREMGFFFLHFRPGPDHYYRQLVYHSCKAGVEPVFATTNYDLLLEHAVRQEGFSPHLGEELRAHGSLTILKLHGSCNFIVRPPPGVTMIGCSATGAREYFRGMFVSAEWPEQAVPLLFQFPDFAPSMSLYAAGKQVLFSGEMIEQAQRCFVRALREVSRVYVIGLRVNEADTHIWDPLASSDCWLGYVGKEPADFTAWADRSNRAHAKVLAPTFSEAMPIIRDQLTTPLTRPPAT